MLKIETTVRRGAHKGATLVPHRYKDGTYVVTKGGNTSKYATHVKRLEEIPLWISSGYGVRMSCAGVPPSIYGSESVHSTTSARGEQ